MRLTTVGLGMALLLVASTAAAAPGKNDLGGSGGKGGSGPGGGGSSPGGGGPGGTDTSFGAIGQAPADPDTIIEAGHKKKAWEISGIWETHRLIRQEDLGETGRNKVFNYLYVGGQYDITTHDRINILGGIYQRFLADPGETGFRMDDITISYTRFIDLPFKLKARISPLFSIPISYESQRQGAITDLRLTLGLSRTFGDLTLDFRTRGDALIDKYTTSGSDGTGGTPNSKWSVGLAGSAEYRMPFHHPLSLGLAAGTSYTWYYNVGNDRPNVLDTQFSGQPIQQSYRAEIFARYILPAVVGIKTDVTIAFANGDPTLGNASVLHDGVSHIYAGYRQNAEVYGSFGIRY